MCWSDRGQSTILWSLNSYSSIARPGELRQAWLLTFMGLAENPWAMIEKILLSVLTPVQK